MILITGATGTVGSEVVAGLLPAQAGQIRVLTRNPGAVLPEGTQKVVADLGDSDLDGHNDRVYELTGPAPLSAPEQVATLSQVLGRELRYAEADPAGMRTQMVVLRHARGVGARRHRDVSLHPGAV